jgi:hypothetical protein
MPPINLDGVRAKIARAGEHRNALHNEIRAYFDSKPYALRKQVNDERTRWSVTMDILREPNAQRFGLIFGDSIHNIRSALDHLFFAIADGQPGSASVKTRSRREWKFPIAGAAPGFAGIANKIGGHVPAAVWAAIEREQPYNRTDPAEAMLIRMVSKLDIADKHHQLPVMMAASPRSGWVNMQNARGQVEMIIDLHFMMGIASPQSGAEIAILTVGEPSPDMDPNFELSTCIALKDASAWSLPDLLDLIIIHVEEVVLRVSSALI